MKYTPTATTKRRLHFTIYNALGILQQHTLGKKLSYELISTFIQQIIESSLHYQSHTISSCRNVV